MSDYLAPDEITRRLHLIMDASIDLPLRDVEQIEGLIQVGERAVAFENLCTQIYEYEIRLPSDLRRHWPRSENSSGWLRATGNDWIRQVAAKSRRPAGERRSQDASSPRPVLLPAACGKPGRRFAVLITA